MVTESQKNEVLQLVETIDSKGMFVEDWYYQLNQRTELEMSSDTLEQIMDELVIGGHIGHYYTGDQQFFCSDVGYALQHMMAELDDGLDNKEIAEEISGRTGMPESQLLDILEHWDVIFD